MPGAHRGMSSVPFREAPILFLALLWLPGRLPSFSAFDTREELNDACWPSYSVTEFYPAHSVGSVGEAQILLMSPLFGK